MHLLKFSELVMMSDSRLHILSLEFATMPVDVLDWNVIRFHR